MTVSGNAKQKGVVAGDERINDCKAENGRRTTKREAGMNATTNYQRESGDAAPARYNLPRPRQPEGPGIQPLPLIADGWGGRDMVVEVQIGWSEKCVCAKYEREESKDSQHSRERMEAKNK